MRARIDNVNIRGCEKHTNKQGGEYLLVRYEDSTGKPEELVDKDMSREQYYKRDTIGDIFISIVETKKYTTIRIVDFKVKEVKE